MGLVLLVIALLALSIRIQLADRKRRKRWS